MSAYAARRAVQVPEAVDPSPMQVDPQPVVATSGPMPATESQLDPEAPPTIYEGDPNTCSFCLMTFCDQERVLRLPCHHVFHARCWHDYVTHSSPTAARQGGTPDCPNCRGPGIIRATWDFVARAPGLPPSPPVDAPRFGHPTGATDEDELDEASLSEAVSRGVMTAPDNAFAINTPRSQESEFQTPHETPDPWLGVWWPSEAPSDSRHTDTRVYSSGVELPDGRLGLLIDTGAWGNLQGEVWCKRAAAQAKAAGYDSSQRKLDTAMTVHGVGSGSQSAVWEASIPTALTRSDSTIGLTKYTAPVVEGADLPPLLGLRSLKANRVVLDLVRNELIMCGPGDCEITPPPGSERYKLEHTPSGHLVLPISAYDKYQQQKASKDTVTALHSSSDAPASSATQEAVGPSCPDLSY